MNKNQKQIESDIKNLLSEKKAIGIVSIDLSSNNSRISDYCLIASGTSSRHAQGLADYVYRLFKDFGGKPHIEGSAKNGWVLVDDFGIEVHIFKPELRSFYNIEELLMTSSDIAGEIQKHTHEK